MLTEPTSRWEVPMLALVLSNVKPDKVERLRLWMHELTHRRDEVLETFVQEGVRHEIAYLIDGKHGPILVYAIEAEDHETARAAYRSSTFPIDIEHKQLLSEVLDGSVQAELLYECRGGARS